MTGYNRPGGKLDTLEIYHHNCLIRKEARNLLWVKRIQIGKREYIPVLRKLSKGADLGVNLSAR